MDWKNTLPRQAAFYLTSRDRLGDHVRHWNGFGWSNPLDLRDLDASAVGRLEHGAHSVRDAGIEWLCSVTFTLDFLVCFPGGLQPLPDDVQVRVVHGGVLYQGHAGGFRHWGEPCSYTLMEPPVADAMRDVHGMDAAGLLEASAQYMREGGPRRMSAQDMARITRTFNQLFGTSLTETHAWALLAMAEVLGGSLPDEQRNKA